MVLVDKRIRYFILFALIMIFVVGSSFIFTQEITNIENSISTKATERANKIKEQILLVRSFITTLRNNMEDNLHTQDRTSVPHEAISFIKYYEDKNLSSIHQSPSRKHYWFNGTFSVIGKLSEQNTDKINEISAAFYLSSTYQSALQSIDNLKWIYYLSKEKFAYIAPNLPEGISNININDYKKEYWQKAIPKNNPHRRLVMTTVYKDSFGKGFLTTFAQPIYFNNTFKGIIAIDISLESINQIMVMNTIIGDSFLLDENKVIIGSNLKNNEGNTLYIPPEHLENNIIFNATDGNDYVSYEILKDEVTFVHRLQRGLKYKAAFFNSFREIILLLSSVVMAYMIYSFRILIFRIGRLANTDPLTSLLNRRAMEIAVLPLLSLSARHDHKICFLIADIDYFKKVNDTYGHVIGDEVLVSTTKVLNSCLRESDLLSRHGGEEFLIVLPQTDLESASLLAERIRTSIENTRTGDKRVGVTISIGCIEVQKDETFDSAISRADKMLYKAKNKGRNKVAVTEEAASDKV